MCGGWKAFTGGFGTQRPENARRTGRTAGLKFPRHRPSRRWGRKRRIPIRAADHMAAQMSRAAALRAGGVRTVGLIIPPSPFLLDERVFVSLGMLTVAASLERAGYRVAVLD